MDNRNQKSIVKLCIDFVFLVLILGIVEGGVVTPKKIGLPTKGTIKTIENLDDGEVIDCVDIHKQPAFHKSSIKTLLMKPSTYPFGKNTIKLSSKIFQNWQKYGECPKGTIPIRRNIEVASRLKYADKSVYPNTTHEYAEVMSKSGNYTGASAEMSVWNPTTEFEGASISKVEVNSIFNSDFNSITAGWIVFPDRTLNYGARIFVYSLGKDDKCYNFDCSFFVQTSSQIAIDSPIQSSVYGGINSFLKVEMFQDPRDGAWWLAINDIVVGYWPSSKLSGLINGADKIAWGGEIVNARRTGKHTTTQMGSGHFGAEGEGKAAKFQNLKVVNKDSTIIFPDDNEEVVTYIGCYDVLSYGNSFYYGGPGYSPICT